MTCQAEYSEMYCEHLNQENDVDLKLCCDISGENLNEQVVSSVKCVSTLFVPITMPPDTHNMVKSILMLL